MQTIIEEEQPEPKKSTKPIPEEAQKTKTGVSISIEPILFESFSQMDSGTHRSTLSVLNVKEQLDSMQNRLEEIKNSLHLLNTFNTDDYDSTRKIREQKKQLEKTVDYVESNIYVLKKRENSKLAKLKRVADQTYLAAQASKNRQDKRGMERLRKQQEELMLEKLREEHRFERKKNLFLARMAKQKTHNNKLKIKESMSRSLDMYRRIRESNEDKERKRILFNKFQAQKAKTSMRYSLSNQRAKQKLKIHTQMRQERKRNKRIIKKQKDHLRKAKLKRINILDTLEATENLTQHYKSIYNKIKGASSDKGGKRLPKLNPFGSRTVKFPSGASTNADFSKKNLSDIGRGGGRERMSFSIEEIRQNLKLKKMKVLSPLISDIDFVSLNRGSNLLDTTI